MGSEEGIDRELGLHRFVGLALALAGLGGVHVQFKTACRHRSRSGASVAVRPGPSAPTMVVLQQQPLHMKDSHGLSINLVQLSA